MLRLGSMKMTARAFAVLFVIGAVSLTLLDSIHVHTHTLVYEHPFAFGSPRTQTRTNLGRRAAMNCEGGHRHEVHGAR